MGLEYSEKEEPEQCFFGQGKCLTAQIKCVISTNYRTKRNLLTLLDTLFKRVYGDSL